MVMDNQEQPDLTIKRDGEEIMSDILEMVDEYNIPNIIPLHKTALAAGCKYRIDENDRGKTIVYSVRNFNMHIEKQSVIMNGEYDVRAFMKLYNETKDCMVRKLMYDAAEQCCYCINDKCTTFLMAKHRTIEFDSKKKKLCGPYRHRLSISVTDSTLSACIEIAEMMFQYTYPHMHKDLFYKNEVTYTLTEKDEFYIVGYMACHNALSKSDDELVKWVLSDQNKIDDLMKASGKDSCTEYEYAGAIDKFENGINYEFIFGVITDRKPRKLPEGMVCRKIRGGQWAVFNSSANDYSSIWREFSANFYNKEHKGYDTSRIPFELYDKDGRLYDVHIPVDPDSPADSAKTVTMQYIPTLRVAGYPMYGETDYPLSKDYLFDVDKRMLEAFSYADKFIGIAIHSFFGKPIQHGYYYAYDDLTPIPEDMEKRDFRGGWFLIEGRKHFNGGVADYPFDRPMNFRTEVDDMHHPGLWIDLHYPNARGGYVELGNPAHIKGKRKFEVVELLPQRIIGKLEAPPESIVTDEEKNSFYTMPENQEKGSYMIGYTIIQPSNAGMYFDKPLVKGVLAKDDTPAPEGYSEFFLEGGKFVKITEDVLNGEPGWEIEGYECIEKETGYAVDRKRQFIIKQKEFGRSYEWYVPCCESSSPKVI